jgi:hypothetical protein
MSGRIERIVVQLDAALGDGRRHRRRGPPGCPRQGAKQAEPYSVPLQIELALAELSCIVA